MAVALTRVSSGEDFELGHDMTRRSHDLAESLHERCSETAKRGREQVECRMHDDDPRFATTRQDPTDGRVHGVYVYLRKMHQGTSAEKWVVGHFDGQAAHHVPVGESEAHRRGKNEWGTAGTVAGYPVEVDKRRLSTGVKPDVLIHGPAALIAVEYQRYHLKKPSAQGRNRNIIAGGARPVWSADRLTGWNSANTVPNVRTNELPEGHSPRDTWFVVGGARFVQAELCSPRNGTACPTKGAGRFCGRYHPRFEPMRGLRVYDVAERAPAGDLVTLYAGRRQGHILVTPAGRNLWADLTGTEPSAVDRPPPVREAFGGEAACRFEPTPAFDAVLNRRSRAGAGSPQRCTTCGVEKLAMADGRCLSCRLDAAYAAPRCGCDWMTAAGQYCIACSHVAGGQR